MEQVTLVKTGGHLQNLNFLYTLFFQIHKFFYLTHPPPFDPFDNIPKHDVAKLLKLYKSGLLLPSDL